jgi:hypothetical protein
MIKPLGTFIGDWKDDMASVMSSATPATWETVRYWRVKTSVGQILDVPSSKLEEDYIADAGGDKNLILTNMEHDISPVFQKMIDEIGLEKSYNRVHVQMTGQVFNWHTDKLARYNREDPSKVLRVVVMLTDWVPGHFYQYGDYTYRDWKAGDIHTFDWQTTPHCTANASLIPRVSLVTTGIIGKKTETFIKEQQCLRKL